MEKLSKHMGRITKAYSKRVKNSQGILDCVHYNKEHSRVECSDSHRLLTYKKEIDSDVLVNLETLEMRSSVNYPKVERLIPSDFDYVLDIKQFNASSIAIFKKAMKKNKEDFKKLIVLNDDLTKITYCKEKNIFSLSNTSEKSFLELKINEVINDDNELEDIYINSKYLLEMLEFLSDYAKEFSDKKEVLLSCYKSVRPMTFKNEDFIYMATPVRVEVGRNKF